MTITPQVQGRRKPSLWQRSRQNGQLTMLLIFLPPAILVFTIFVMLPMLQAGSLPPINGQAMAPPLGW